MTFSEFSTDVAELTQNPLDVPVMSTDNRSALQRLLDDLSFKELLEARTLLTFVIQDRASIEQDKLKATAAQLADYFGVSLEEVVQSPRKRGRKGHDETTLKYRHPTDPSKTWNGKGRKPAWFSEAVAVA